MKIFNKNKKLFFKSLLFWFNTKVLQIEVLLKNKRLLFLFISLVFNSCTNRDAFRSRSAKDRCISDVFAQGQDKNLYGKNCIQGKSLLVKTAKEGEEVTTFQIAKQLKIKDEKGFFFNTFYNLDYNIQRGQGDDNSTPFLKDLLGDTTIKMAGSKNTTYHILFETHANYLILYKATKTKDNIPWTQKTSLTTPKTKDGLYKVPFIGYPIKYCKAELIKNNQGEETYLNRLVCEGVSPSEAKYIKLLTETPQTYKYQNKENLFPVSYFDGEWFFSRSMIEDSSTKEQDFVGLSKTYKVRLDKTVAGLNLIDLYLEQNREQEHVRHHFPVKWQEYEMDKDGDRFISFSERVIDEGKNNSAKTVKKPYVSICFDCLSVSKNLEGKSITELLIEPNHLSFIEEGAADQNKLKIKTSLLKSSQVDTKNFVPKKAFLNDLSNYFNIIQTGPLVLKEAEHTIQHATKDLRMIRFNTDNGVINLDTGKKETVIKWYLSNQSVKEECHFVEGTSLQYCEKYSKLIQTAIDIWNKAFEIITKNTDKRIKIELVKNKNGDYEKKQLGDIRFNIINLILKRINTKSIFLGVALPIVDIHTGQTIAGANNIIIHNIEESFFNAVRQYIRFEISFKKDDYRKDLVIAESHVISSHLIEKIKEKCPEVEVLIDRFVNKKHENYYFFSRRLDIEDKDYVLICGKKLAEEALLDVMLHELGHNFGLGHNFKASIDEKNAYKKIEEITKLFPKEDFPHIEKFFPNLKDKDLKKYNLPKYSSVMDYNPIDESILPVVGKYDIAALRYLYMGQIEDKDGKIVDLKIDPNPKEQKSLTEKLYELNITMKSYEHCSDWIALDRIINILNQQPEEVRDFLCIRHDAGSNPEEIVEYYLNKRQRFLNQRYSYDTNVSDSVFSTSSLNKNNLVDEFDIDKNHYSCSHGGVLIFTNELQVEGSYKIQNIKELVEKNSYKIQNINDVTNQNLLNIILNPIIAFYDYWLYERDKKLIFGGIPDYDIKQSSLNRYTDLKSPDEGDEQNEYPLYYPIADLVQDYLLDQHFFTQTMKCQVKDSSNRIYSIDLEDIKNAYNESQSNNDFYVEDCLSGSIVMYLTLNQLKLIHQTGVEDFSSYFLNAGGGEKDVVPILNTLDYKLFNYFSFELAQKEPDFLDKFKNKLEDLLLSKENGYSDTDYNKLLSFYKRLTVSITKTDIELNENNKNYFKVVRFSKYGINNFTQYTNKRILSSNIAFFTSMYDNFNQDELVYNHDQSLAQNELREILQQSELVDNHSLSTQNELVDNHNQSLPTQNELRDNFNRVLQQSEFKDYLLKQSVELGNSYYFPFESGSFLEKAIKTYKENSITIRQKKAIIEHKKQKNQSYFLDQVKLNSAKRHNQALEQIITTKITNNNQGLLVDLSD